MAEDLSPSCKTPEAWVGCYKGNWDYLTPASMSHPAKMAPALAHRILDHLEELGWLKPGMRILDFMAGTGLTGLMAGSRGYGSTLVELEERFAKMIGQNREALEKKLGHPIDMEIIQGDARNLSQLLKGEQGDEVSVSHTPDGSGWDRRMAGNQPTHPSVAITSPPYSTAQEGGGISARMRGKGNYHLTTNLPGSVYQPAEHGSTPGQIGNLKDEPIGIVSPPYSTTLEGTSRHTKGGIPGREPKYAELGGAGFQSKDNIASLPDKPIGIVSPPYGDTLKEAKPLSERQDKMAHILRKRRPNTYDKTGAGSAGHGYGEAEGQIGSLPNVAIVSPPYEATSLHGVDTNPERLMGGPPAKASHGGGQVVYINPISQGQIGQEQGQTYLSAMRQVYAEAFKVCPILVVIVKDPTRNGKLRELGKDTVSLLEQVGYQIHCIHKAILFEEQEQGHLFEGSKKKLKGRISFFKLLSYKKGLPVSNFEHVIFAVKKDLCVSVEKTADARHLPISAILDAEARDRSQETSWANEVDHPRGDKNISSGYGSAPGQIGKLK